MPIRHSESESASECSVVLTRFEAYLIGKTLEVLKRIADRSVSIFCLENLLCGWSSHQCGMSREILHPAVIR
jgi:hypothetical protein